MRGSSRADTIPEFAKLPPLRERMKGLWGYVVVWVGFVFGGFFIWPVRDVLTGWLVGAALYGVMRLAARKPLLDSISTDSEFALDAHGRVHVLTNKRHAFRKQAAWSEKQEKRDFWLQVVQLLIFFFAISAAFVLAENYWDRSVVVSAFSGGVTFMFAAEGWQATRGRRSFRASEGGVVLNPLVFGSLFSSYVDSDRFDPNNPTPHIDTVLEATFARLDPEQRAQMTAETKRRLGLSAGPSPSDEGLD